MTTTRDGAERADEMTPDEAQQLAHARVTLADGGQPLHPTHPTLGRWADWLDMLAQDGVEANAASPMWRRTVQRGLRDLAAQLRMVERAALSAPSAAPEIATDEIAELRETLRQSREANAMLVESRAKWKARAETAEHAHAVVESKLRRLPSAAPEARSGDTVTISQAALDALCNAIGTAVLDEDGLDAAKAERVLGLVGCALDEEGLAGFVRVSASLPPSAPERNTPLDTETT